MLEVNGSLRDCVSLTAWLIWEQRRLRGKDFRGFFELKPLGMIDHFDGWDVPAWIVVGIPEAEEER